MKNKINAQDKAGKIKKKMPKHFPVVGIGASAGGLEALELFFKNMPPDSGMAFVVIQHLDPNHTGMMPELLQRITQIKVLQATDRLQLQPNHLYVIPPNKSMSLLNGALHLFDPVAYRGLRLPIDIFFRSLANDQQEESIGIILSGMGSDGSLGLKAIKEKCGIVLVQEPETAKFDGMPRSALEAVNADIIAPAEELPSRLIALLSHKPMERVSPDEDTAYVADLEKVIILLREYSGHDFSLYKKNTLYRRIERRKGVHQIVETCHYVRFLQENPSEIGILFEELLIGVTSFFRDQAVWEELGKSIFPLLIKTATAGTTLRAWVPACSTGEEAYTLAMVFVETLEKVSPHKKISLQIFATDLDINAINKARKGVFSENITHDISKARIDRFFKMENGQYHLNSFIREMCVFAQHNVIKDPPFTRIDVLSCRNLMIYIEAELQFKLLKLFNYSMNMGGILILGSAETAGGEDVGLIEIDARMKIFKKSSKVGINDFIDLPSSLYQKKNMIPKKKEFPQVAENIQNLADQLLLQQFAPAGCLVNANGDILYITGRTGKYLEPTAGRANWNIHAMARDGIREVLPAAFRKAKLSYKPVLVKNVVIETNGLTQMLDVTVQRIDSPKAIRGMIMVVFSDVLNSREEGKPKKEKLTGNLIQKDIKLQLLQCQENLKIAHEEMQTTQEELKSTNEELQSTNEELQSTNEELTTSKEELQSLNEELQTANIELQTRVSDFIRANDDMKNLLNSIEIATLFLDKELNIRRFTDQTAKIFKIRSSDIGRPFTDLVSQLIYPDIAKHAQQVIKTLSSIESAISTSDGKWFNIRIIPYRTMDDRIDGLVMTFTDISVSKKLEIELQKTNDLLTKKVKKQ